MPGRAGATQMIVVGIDLAGPRNTPDTALTCFSGDQRSLNYATHVLGATDQALFDLVRGLGEAGDVVVGLDAPLSYNPGGGDRPGDSTLRERIVRAGLGFGWVMAPTMARMVYLTLRGVCVARALAAIQPRPPRVVEVHPTASLALRGAPIEAVRRLKANRDARGHLLEWLAEHGLHGIARPSADASDEVVAACACAFAAWKWACDETVWCERAAPPLHPYDLAC